MRRSMSSAGIATSRPVDALFSTETIMFNKPKARQATELLKQI
jgi:hypothetical protein